MGNLPALFPNSTPLVSRFFAEMSKKRQRCTVAAVEISDRKDLNTLYKFRNLISVNRIFIKDYQVSVSIWRIRSEAHVTFEMPQLSDLQKCVWLRDGVSIRAFAREINVDNVWVTFGETSLSIPFTKLKVWRCQSVWVFNGRNCTYCRY
jgi:hypothetical protein